MSIIVVTFPYVASFSSTMLDCYRIVQYFIKDSMGFISYEGQLNFFSIVKKYLD